MGNEAFSSWVSSIQQQLEAFLCHQLPASHKTPARLHEAMRYATLAAGKRVRPLLVFAAGELSNAANQDLIHIAAAIEILHSYSLVHDDMPAMDNDTLRRGKPACHIAFGEATALLAGDALQAMAFELICCPMVAVEPTTQLAMVHLLARAAGYAGMAGGQGLDLASVGQSITLPELEFLHLLKTGALIRSSVMLAAMAGKLDSAAHDCLDYFAKRIGLAFQIVDDVLDYQADTSTLGKTAGKDAAASKPTYVSLMGVNRARELIRDLHTDAFTALTAFGPCAQRLKELADYIVTRSF